jgi:Predicted metal-dependent hydrolase of the TIM-barrel fold
LYHISVNDEWLYPLYNLIQECKGIIFVHFGKLLMRPRDYAGIPLMTNEEFSNPKDLIPVAKMFSGIKFIIPNFGAGKLAETLLTGQECKNVYVDTAGSNSWITEHSDKPDMRRVFQKFLDIFTANRILFGSDSGLLPRGYRYDIVDNQLKLVEEMRLPVADIKKIFYENMAGLVDNG